MSQLRPGWANTEIGAIAETQLGKMLSKKAKVGTEPRSYLRNKSVQWGRIDLDDLPKMDFSLDELERFEVVDGDLLVCEGGEVGRAAIYRGQLDWVGYQKALHRVRPVPGVSAEFLLYCFMWLAQSHLLEKHITGSTINHLPQEDLRQIAFPLPPLNEQCRIVAAIEEKLSRLGAAEASLVVAAKRLDGMRRAVYSAAFDGDWDCAELSAVAEVRLGRQRSPKNHAGPHMRRYLRAANVTWAGLDLSDVGEMNFEPDEVATYRLEPGDILVVEASGSASEVGKTAMWRGEIELCCLQNTLLRVRAHDVRNSFLRLVLQQSAVLGEFGRASPGVGIHHLGAARLSAWPIPLPPLDEQRRIVAQVEEQLSGIDALRSAIDRAQRRSRSLRRAVLERAFRGELVPQDPSDEPASVLLERIRAQRVAIPARPRRRRVNI